MCDCIEFLLVLWNGFWRRATKSLSSDVRSGPHFCPAFRLEFVEDRKEISQAKNAGVSNHSTGPGTCPRNKKHALYLMKSDSRSRSNRSKDEVPNVVLNRASREVRHASNGRTNTASLFTMKGFKSVNQDAMIVIQNFASRKDAIFCGVFDGHGPDGHLIAQNVRDVLPRKLASHWKSQSSLYPYDGETNSSGNGKPGDSLSMTLWKESFIVAYKLMDMELSINKYADCFYSGTTAVALVKQGNILIIGNVGDSRAVLGTRDANDSVSALQLTTDLKPDIPREAERIKWCKGRVFALKEEPSVLRVWLPYYDAPGLAMARSLGDYCLKKYGIIADPEVSCHHLTTRDEFVVLATDGVWDVLSNEEVVKIVASTTEKSLAARMVVERAVCAWKSKCAVSRIDDCAVVCLFL